MAGGGARRGTLVIHYGTGHRRPAPRPRQPRDGTGSCGNQPANQSLLDRRLQRRPLSCAISVSYRPYEVVTDEGSQGKLVSERSRPGSSRSAFQAAQAAWNALLVAAGEDAVAEPA